MAKRFSFLFLIIFLGGFLFFPLSSFAEYNIFIAAVADPPGTGATTTKEIFYKGIVPCGKPVWTGTLAELQALTPGKCCIMPCTFCHFFVMLDGIIDFVLINVVPPLAVLMLVIGGVMYMFAHFGEGGPAMLSRAKKVMTSVVIGLIIIFAAWLIIDKFFEIIDVTEWTGLAKGWYSVKCPTQIGICIKRLGDPECQKVGTVRRTPCALMHVDGTPVEASECK